MRGELVDAVAQLEQDALGHLRADARHGAQRRNVVAADRGEELGRRETGEHRLCQPRADPVGLEEQLEGGALGQRAEAEQLDGALFGVGVDVQRHVLARIRQLGEGRQRHVQLVTHPSDVDDDPRGGVLHQYAFDACNHERPRTWTRTRGVARRR